MSDKHLRHRLQEILFEADTKAGKAFDIVLLILIVASVFTVVIETINGYAYKYPNTFFYLEWFFTIIFTIEYFLRLISVKKPLSYVKSYYGIIDLISILPSYLSLFFIGTKSLLVIRALRILRVFRIFKLTQFLSQGDQITKALKKSRPKITVFLTFILLVVTIIGSLMYLIEMKENSGFDNIPRGIYWAIVTLTTVGYGDIHPNSPLGQALASFVMILGYSVIAVPTGIISTELTAQAYRKNNSQVCETCCEENHDDDAVYCRKCGEKLNIID